MYANLIIGITLVLTFIAFLVLSIWAYGWFFWVAALWPSTLLFFAYIYLGLFWDKWKDRNGCL